MTVNPFQKATRTQLRARVALDGPSGAGKTWTALEWATVLAAGGTVAVIDTERGSAALYSDRFDFDVVAMEPPYEPARLVELLKTAQAHGYAAVVVDSLSHFWEGEGGTLDMVDAASAKAKGNTFAGWKAGTPALRHLIDTMLGLDAHLVATMRSKTEWVLETDQRGKQVPRRVGMAPVMRAGVEYEFTLVGDMDHDHQILVTKSRCSSLDGELVAAGRAGEAAERFRSWLDDGEAQADPAAVSGLVERMNGLPADVRGDVKRRFVESFGRPDSLPASRLEAAVAWVEEQAGGPDDEGPPDDDGPGTPAPAPPDEGPVDESGPVGLPLDEEDPGRPFDEAAVERSRRALMARLTEVGLREDGQRHAVIAHASKRRTESSTAATEPELREAHRVLDAVNEGVLEVWRRASGGFVVRQRRGRAA